MHAVQVHAQQKSTIKLRYKTQVEFISWYHGCTEEGLNLMIKCAFSISNKTRFLLIDPNDGCVVAISPSIPSGLELELRCLEDEPEAIKPQMQEHHSHLKHKDPDDHGCSEEGTNFNQKFQGELLKFERINAHLANERTWLAWVRTALAVLAAAFSFLNLTQSFVGGAQIYVFCLGCFFIANTLVAYFTGWFRYSQVRDILGLPGHQMKPNFNRLGLGYQAKFLGALLIVTAISYWVCFSLPSSQYLPG